jgi:hypothetical protein
VNVWQKIFVGSLATVVWLISIAAHHVYPDIDVSALILTAQSVIGGLGITHVITAKNGAQEVPNVELPQPADKVV